MSNHEGEPNEQITLSTIEELRELALSAHEAANTALLQEIEEEALRREERAMEENGGWGYASLAYGGLAVACRREINFWEGKKNG